MGIIMGYLDLGRRKRKEQQEVKRIESEAQGKAEKILRQAQDKALEILEKTRLDTEARSEKLEAKLDRAEEKQVAEFKKAVGDAAPAILGQKIDEEFAQAKLEIQRYKDQRLKEIDAKAVDIIKDVTRRTLGKALDTTKHTALITGALEEARLTHVL